MTTPWYSTKTFRLCLMLILTFGYFLVEIIVGHITSSVALMADAYHMLSDVLALVIALIAVRFSKRRSNNNTYGWVRAEVLGANANTVFLLALSFTIIMSAIERFVTPEMIKNPILLLIVGSIGLGINIIGLFLFQGFHGHSHGGSSGHSHGRKNVHGHSHDHDEAHSKPDHSRNDGHITIAVVEKMTNPSEFTRHSSRALEEVISSQVSEHEDPQVHENPSTVETKKKKSSLNMYGIFLHVLADALGSVVVIVSALLIKFVPHDPNDQRHWTVYIDPALSTIIVFVITLSTIPLLKESSLILLQAPPADIQADKIKEELLDQISEIAAIHDLHVWRLTGEKNIVSAHLRLRQPTDQMNTALKVKQFFHSLGIHSTTMQFEYPSYERLQEVTNRTDEQHLDCLVRCTHDTCDEQTCCNKDLTAANAMNSKYGGLRPRHTIGEHVVF